MDTATPRHTSLVTVTLTLSIVQTYLSLKEFAAQEMAFIVDLCTDNAVISSAFLSNLQQVMNLFLALADAFSNFLHLSKAICNSVQLQ